MWTVSAPGHRRGQDWQFSRTSKECEQTNGHASNASLTKTFYAFFCSPIKIKIIVATMPETGT